MCQTPGSTCSKLKKLSPILDLTGIWRAVVLACFCAAAIFTFFSSSIFFQAPYKSFHCVFPTEYRVTIGKTRALKAGGNAEGLIPKPQHDKFPASTLVLYRLDRTSPS